MYISIRLFCILTSSLILALCIGILSINFFLNHDSAFKKLIERQVTSIFLHSFKGDFTGTLKYIDLVTGQLEFENVMVTAPHNADEWHWQADSFTVQFSWISYVLRKKFDITVFLHNLDSHSVMVGTSIPIIDHLQSFIAAAAGFPATLKMLTITKGHFTLNDQQRTLRYTTYFNGSYGNLKGWLRLHVTTHGSELLYNNQTLFDNFNGTLNISIPDVKNNVINATISGNLHLPQVSNNSCQLEGHWYYDNGQFFLHTSDNRYAITFYNWNKKSAEYEGDVSITLPIEYVSCFIPHIKKISLEGTAHCQAHIKIDKKINLNAELRIQDACLLGKNLGTMNVELFCNNGIWQVTSKNFYSSCCDEDIRGELTYSENSHAGHGTITTTTPLALSNGWSSNMSTINFTIRNNTITGHYTFDIQRQTPKDHFLLEGAFTHTGSSITTRGNFNAKIFDCAFTTDPFFTIQQCTVYEKPEKKLLRISSSDGKTIQGIIDLELLQEISNYLLHYKISGQGVFLLKGALEDSVAKISLEMQEGNIRIPETYTIIRGITGVLEADVFNKRVIIRNGKLSLDKGTIACNQAVICFNNAAIPLSMHIPCTINKAFLTIHKELFAMLSGSLLYTYELGQPSMVQGKLILDRSYCKKNIFSQVDTRMGNVPFLARSQEYLLNLSLETKNPLDVKTSFLETKVHIDCSLQGNLQNPELSGSINLENGTLAFPYRPLTITHGTIYFLPHQLYDPTIELVAKGKIRKYQVTLRCNGSLQHPHINFESTPSLTEEQIITLLLAGSEEGSLSLAMPALIMQKVQNVIFGPEQSALKLEGYFKSLLAPLKHIRFIPGFSDQSGRGGFRGSIEIDVNDQLRAMIQKNFSLTEDIKVEVEYFLSDDITIRGIRDERTDLGGEIEMRWKF